MAFIGPCIAENVFQAMAGDPVFTPASQGRFFSNTNILGELAPGTKPAA